MLIRTLRMLAIVSLSAGAWVAIAAPAASGAGPVFTTITAPSHNLIFRYNGEVAPSANTFIVKGKASAGVDAVNIDCVATQGSAPDIQQLASNVPVSGSGTFTTVASFADSSVGLTVNCRLRAVPTTADTTDYLGSFSGPILYVNGYFGQHDGSTVYGMVGVGEQGDGLGEVTSAGECGTAAVDTVETPSMEVRGVASIACAFGLTGSNFTPGGTPNASSIKVDGHNAYLPGAVHDFLNGTRSLGLTQPALSISVSRPNNKGDVILTESAPLKRCSPDDTFPPTLASCTSLVNTGVTFKRVSLVFRGAHQVRVRDTFTANGSAHTVSAQYQGVLDVLPTGAPGFLYPGRSTFQVPTPGQSVTGLHTGAGTLFVRTDKFAGIDEPDADTYGLSWSRAPQKVLFDGMLANSFAMPYSLHVPANRSAYLGFAYSEHLLTADAKPLAALAVADMMSSPTISSPHNGAKIAGHSVTVTGSAPLGANGLPTSVKVNGHLAHLTVNAHRTSVAYRVTFSETLGRHTLTATATDSAGNSRSQSVNVTNVAP